MSLRASVNAPAPATIDRLSRLYGAATSLCLRCAVAPLRRRHAARTLCYLGDPLGPADALHRPHTAPRSPPHRAGGRLWTVGVWDIISDHFLRDGAGGHAVSAR